MHQFLKSSERWWQKPLVQLGKRHIPAELAVLQMELRVDENGAWLNSRGTITGTVELTRDAAGKFKTKRVKLPAFASNRLRSIYETAGLSRGAPDLITWNQAGSTVRFVEVKCPHWDTPSEEQIHFMNVARKNGTEVSIVEWEFRSD